MMAKTAPEATIEAARLEELRFAKRQQWAITAAVVTFIAGAYTVVKPLGPWEKAVATIVVTVAVVAGIRVLFDLQRHLCRTRLAIDRYDPEAWERDLHVVYPMAIALIISAVAVCYSFWHDLIPGM